MRYCVLVCCLIGLAGCCGSRTACKTGPAPETATVETATVVNEDGQVVLPSGDLFGAPAPTDKIGVSKPYILKMPICVSSSMKCTPNIVPKSIVLGLPPVDSTQQATTTAGQ